MAWIRTVPEDEATGLLRSIYRASRRRAGKVFQVVRIQGLRPRVLEAGMQSYVATMLGRSPLRRWEREAIAVTVSRKNGCHY